MNKNKLKALMCENGDTAGMLADYLGITKSAFSKKINEKSCVGFTQPEILKIKERYSLSGEEIDLIFFNH